MDSLPETSAEILYQAPASMYVLFWMAGMAFVVSATRWLIHIIKSPNSPRAEFKTHIWSDQILNIFFVCVLSIVIGFYDHHYYGLPINIMGECSLLALGTIGIFIASKTNAMHAVSQFYIRFLSFGLLCLIGWSITAAAAYLFHYGLKATTIMSHDDYLLVSFMMTGILWCAPILILYKKIIRHNDLRQHLNGSGFNKFLWPILLAYLTLLLPLMMQEIANSENWRKMTNKKPLRAAQMDIFEQHNIFPFV
ncbi:MAG: hypothetical protein ACRBDI_04140 [Alphaproteobacteria bacterium]